MQPAQHKKWHLSLCNVIKLQIYYGPSIVTSTKEAVLWCRTRILIHQTCQGGFWHTWFKISGQIDRYKHNSSIKHVKLTCTETIRFPIMPHNFYFSLFQDQMIDDILNINILHFFSQMRQRACFTSQTYETQKKNKFQHFFFWSVTLMSGDGTRSRCRTRFSTGL